MLGENLLTGALGLLALSLGCVLSVCEFTQVLLLGAGCAGEGTRPMAVPGAAGGRVPLAVSLGCHIPAMPGPHQGVQDRSASALLPQGHGVCTGAAAAPLHCVGCLGRVRSPWAPQGQGCPSSVPLCPGTLTPLRHCWGCVSSSRLIYARANSQLPLLSSWGPSVLIGTDEPVSTRHCGWEMSLLREVASCNSQAPAEGSRWVLLPPP